MRVRIGIIVIALLVLATPAFAHRLDEYLEATTISVEQGRVSLRLRLTAGVSVASKVLSLIDGNGDGVVSDAEQQAYAERVRSETSMGLDGRPVPSRLRQWSFPAVDEIRKGVGVITLEFAAELPEGGNHTLAFENHHLRSAGVYLVNTLLPSDQNIHILGQDRSRDQSSYQLQFGVGPAAMPSPSALHRAENIAVVTTYVGHGVHHILSGYDHLLFLCALVLAATTLWDLVKVVTAFTVAHSTTLTLAALNLVHLPGYVVEPVIAASIVFVATQNIFWSEHARGRARLAVAFAFGLFHGLGFAGGLLDVMQQMPPATILLAILGFSVGVEIGNQMVLLPLFSLLRVARRHRSATWTGRVRSMPFRQLASAGASVAGLYYLYLALAGAS